MFPYQHTTIGILHPNAGQCEIYGKLLASDPTRVMLPNTASQNDRLTLELHGLARLSAPMV